MYISISIYIYIYENIKYAYIKKWLEVTHDTHDNHDIHF